ncbi:MAG: tripartite tricarboxylate transporter substrate binding protein [Betaproteobacteria bacterium]|nr:tripartite tricarboxylate transporter substrate binding protein [Betaproteobacteria bacterium]
MRIITGSVGSTSDQLARFMAQKFTDRWGQQFVVDNRAGAGGTIGTGIAAKAAPDGYTLTVGQAGTHVSAVSLFKNLPYDPLRDFAPISLLTKGVTVLVVHPSVPAKSVQELIALGKQKGNISWGSAGTGTISHLTGELFTQVTGVNFLHVPYKGAGPALTAFLSPVTAHAQLKAGKLKAFAVSSRTRFPGTPEIPSAVEAGVPGIEALLWFGIFAPARTPQAIVMKLNREINETLNRPDVKESLLKLGAMASPTTPQEFRAFIESELKKWTPIIQAAGIRAD